MSASMTDTNKFPVKPDKNTILQETVNQISRITQEGKCLVAPSPLQPTRTKKKSEKNKKHSHNFLYLLYVKVQQNKNNRSSTAKQHQKKKKMPV